MRLLVFGLVLAALMVPMVTSGTITDDLDPVRLGTSWAAIRGRSVSVPVQNLSYDPVVVEVTALYNDGTEVHSAQVMVSLAPKGSALATVVFTTTEDLDLVGITEGPDPIPQFVVMGTVLWDD